MLLCFLKCKNSFFLIFSGICIRLQLNCSVFQLSDAKQRKATLQKVVEKAKVGRQDTVIVRSK